MSDRVVEEPRAIRQFSDLLVWQRAFRLGTDVFTASKAWPAEERFSLTSQVRRSSRSIGANIAEAWGKRRYEAAFVAKLTDADAEAHETEHWLLTAEAHGYIDQNTRERLAVELRHIGRMLGSMMANPRPFLLKSVPDPRPAPRGTSDI